MRRIEGLPHFKTYVSNEITKIPDSFGTLIARVLQHFLLQESKVIALKISGRSRKLGTLLSIKYRSTNLEIKGSGHSFLFRPQFK